MELENVLKIIEKTDDNFPIKIAYKNNHRYYHDFIDVLKYFKQILSNKQFNELVNKFQFQKPFDQQKYLQTVSEITILYYILRYYNKTQSFIYEPKYNGGYNPECSFKYIDKTVNIEVKCPNLETRLNQEKKNTLKIFLADRIPDHDKIIKELSNIIRPNIQDSDYDDIDVKNRLDNKLKDFLIHSQKKFPISDDSNFNILAIALDKISDLDEWYLYIFGNNGVFTDKPFVKDSYDKIDAILLTTPVHNHIEWNSNVNSWNLEESKNILFLNPDREHSETGKYYIDHGISIFGKMTKDFLTFQNYLDQQLNKKYNCLSDIESISILRNIDFKFNESRIITEFLNYLKK